MRQASGTKVGDSVTAEVALDAAYRGAPMYPMPAWFRVPLNKDRRARKAWNALIPSRRKEVLRYFPRLKSLEARARNLARALRGLSVKRERFMARSWNKGF